MVGGSHGLAGLANLRAASPEAGECLRAGDLVNEVKIDRENCRGSGVGRRYVVAKRHGVVAERHRVVAPDLLDKGARLLSHRSTRDLLPRLTADGGHRGYQMIARGRRGRLVWLVRMARLRRARRSGEGGCRATNAPPGSRTGPARSARSSGPGPSRRGHGPRERAPAPLPGPARVGRRRSP